MSLRDFIDMANAHYSFKTSVLKYHVSDFPMFSLHVVLHSLSNLIGVFDHISFNMFFLYWACNFLLKFSRKNSDISSKLFVLIAYSHVSPSNICPYSDLCHAIILHEVHLYNWYHLATMTLYYCDIMWLYPLNPQCVTFTLQGSKRHDPCAWYLCYIITENSW